MGTGKILQDDNTTGKNNSRKQRPRLSDKFSPFRMSRIQPKKGGMFGQLKLCVRHKKYATARFDYLFVSKGEMEQILKGRGWRVDRFIDSDGLYIAILGK